MKGIIFFFALLISNITLAQIPVDFSQFDKKSASTAVLQDGVLSVTWPAGENEKARLVINLDSQQPLIRSLQLSQRSIFKEVASNLNPVFILTVGKRDLTKASGWNIFFDKTAFLPYVSHKVAMDKKHLKVTSAGARTVVALSDMNAVQFSGVLEFTLYHGSPLLNVAAVMSTKQDSTAIIYDAGFTSNGPVFKEMFWSDTNSHLQSSSVSEEGPSVNLAVKYRTIIGETDHGSVAVFPPPHQYFYPLDNAFNLKYTWYGSNYRDLISEFGMGIRHDLMGDRRHVPWFNSPPDTDQRLGFFCLLSGDKDGQVIHAVKKFTHGDSYKPLSGYKTMVSHFHTEHVNDVLTHVPLPEVPGHVKALRDIGVNIMHLGEFHLAGNPHDPGLRRLSEFKVMFEECERLSSGDFLMLPGEEPNSHFGGHWMNLFPKPVYWIMSREPGQPFESTHPQYGKVYRVGSQQEMLKLLEAEGGLAWTAHARTKGSTGFPDQYRNEKFFHSDRFFGAAWKPIPADLSQPRLGKRVLDLMDDMANWGHKKYAIGEADLFKLEPDYEIYGHLNVNYLQLDELPKFREGWQPVLDAMEGGRFFVTTGEVLIPSFMVNGKHPGQVLKLVGRGSAEVIVEMDWTFPLNFVEIVSGDGTKVHRQRISMQDTKAFGNEAFKFNVDLKGRRWVRFEVWDVAANGAFTQFVWLE